MAVKLSSTELPQLLSWLQGYFPKTFKIHGELKSCMDSQTHTIDFHVDRWPDPRAAVGFVVPERQQQITSRTQLVAGVFSVTNDAAIGLIKHLNIVTEDKGFVFLAVPKDLQGSLLTLIEEKKKGQKITQYPCTLLRASQQDLKPLDIPEGVKFQPISGGEDIKTIQSTWRHGEQVSESYIAELVQRFPSLFLVTEQGQHVGHMLCSSDGTMGILHVNPEFRRRGFAKLIVSHLAQKFFERGEDAYVFIEDYNEASHNLHRAIGFKPVEDFVFMLCD